MNIIFSKITAYYKKSKTIISQHINLIFYISLILSILIRIIGTFYLKSNDYTMFLSPWIGQFKNISILDGLRLQTDITDYYVPYNIILIILSHVPFPSYIGISLISCLCDFGISYYIYHCFNKAFPSSQYNKIIAISILLLPFSFIDSAFWKQCDSIYALFAIASLYYYFTQRYTRAFLLFSIGFVFKLQIIFLLPFYGILWLKKHYHSVLQFIWMPLMYLLTGLPSILAGADPIKIYSIYRNQTTLYTTTCNSYPNIWNMLPTFVDNPAILIGIVLAVIMLLLFYQNNLSKISLSSLEDYLWLSGVTIWTCTMFLPCMHERYDYLALILLWLYALTTSRKHIPALIIITQIIMTRCYATLFHIHLLYILPLSLFSLIYFILYLRILDEYTNFRILILDFVQSTFKHNKQ